MRKLAYILPAVLMSGCSLFNQTSGFGESNQYYESNCQPSACQSGSAYSVNEQASYAPYSQQQGLNQYASAAPSYAPYSQDITNQIVHDVPALRGSIPYNGQILESSAAYAAPVAYAAAPTYRRAQPRNPGYFYGTLGGVLHDTTIDSIGVEGRLGYHTGSFIGAEVEGSYGFVDDKDIITTGATPVLLDHGFDYNAAAFAIARLPVSNRLSVHARGGYDFRKFDVTSIDNTGTETSGDIDVDGFAYGLGAEYALGQKNGLRLDYTRYENDDISTSDSISASYYLRF